MNRPATILTVALEEFFHGGALAGVVLRKHWERFGSRMARNLDDVLAMLAAHERRATFFVSGWVAERDPELVARCVRAGHELGSAGWWPGIGEASGPDRFADDLCRALEVLQGIAGAEILGFRAPSVLGPGDEHILRAVGEAGFRYDASARVGSLAAAAAVPWLGAPATGGALRRMRPRRAARVLERLCAEPPRVFHFDSWELDAQQPRIAAFRGARGTRHYRNLGVFRRHLEGFLSAVDCASAAAVLGLQPEARPGVEFPKPTPAAETPKTGGETVTLVVPMCNEEDNVDYLLRTLDQVVLRLAGRYRLDIIPVDDGSTDSTWQVLQQRARERDDLHPLRHEGNRGVAAAIATGLRAATSDIVASVDCDCSYDPHDLEHMIGLLADADLVTASPYHPDGQVLNVPGWRLLLSRTLSCIYRCVLGSDLHTFTSCFRVYRRQAVADLPLDSGGFLGVAEFLVRLLRRGGRVVEYPTLLESRMFGVSKMKTLGTIGGHLGLIVRILFGRLDREGKNGST